MPLHRVMTIVEPWALGGPSLPSSFSLMNTGSLWRSIRRVSKEGRRNLVHHIAVILRVTVS